jgi:hypothetical protein
MGEVYKVVVDHINVSGEKRFTIYLCHKDNGRLDIEPEESFPYFDLTGVRTSVPSSERPLQEPLFKPAAFKRAMQDAEALECPYAPRELRIEGRVDHLDLNI